LRLVDRFLLDSYSSVIMRKRLLHRLIPLLNRRKDFAIIEAQYFGVQLVPLLSLAPPELLDYLDLI
jgi:hypothetical protein